MAVRQTADRVIAFWIRLRPGLLGPVLIMNIDSGISHQRLIILKIENPVTRLYALLYNMIRDQDIKKKINVLAGNPGRYVISANFEDLKIMCGIVRIKEETIRPFLSDSNIDINQDTITIISRKRLEEKLVFFKTRAGQIASNLVWMGKTLRKSN